MYVKRKKIYVQINHTSLLINHIAVSLKIKVSIFLGPNMQFSIQRGLIPF